MTTQTEAIQRAIDRAIELLEKAIDAGPGYDRLCGIHAARNVLRSLPAQPEPQFDNERPQAAKKEGE